mmetsp:Transcript_12141/g.36627  ORF Transcript_12141/g.36627 Transcript_12141/m.36627 type:complete len:209 (-) Transcript_12141:46-672(-)
MASATRRCPGWGLCWWMKGWKDWFVPRRAWKKSACAPSASRRSRRKSWRQLAAMPVITDVPLTMARPSFGSSASGSSPSCLRTSRHPATSPSSPTSTSTWGARPVTAPMIWARGARSPLAPMDPNSRTRGTAPALRKATTRSMISKRTPEAPWRWLLQRNSIAARTSSRGRKPPAPAFMNLNKPSWSPRASSRETRTLARPPKPVVTP